MQGLLNDTPAKALSPGNFVDQEGHVLGQHKGIICYTIGQRKGLGLALQEPMYVCRIDPKTNTVVLGRDRDLWSKGADGEGFPLDQRRGADGHAAHQSENPLPSPGAVGERRDHRTGQHSSGL